MKGKKQCGFCCRHEIDPKAESKTKAGTPICDQCAEDWNRCFPPTLTTVNNLPIVQASLTKPGEVNKWKNSTPA